MSRKKESGDQHKFSVTEAILESISDGVFTVNSDWLVTSFNRSAEKITGVGREEAIGRHCSDVFRSSLCGVSCALEQTLRTGKPVINKSAYFINAEGDRIPISISTAVLKNEKGEVIGGAETFRDLSEVEALHQQLDRKYSIGDFVSSSPVMQRLFNIIPAIAESPSTVLITGDTGTGKEVLARTIHEHSQRKEKAFIAVNCGALPDNLLESELFGYKAGAFTGASHDKLGRFALAEGGTLFLDEIGEVSKALQVRLLRVLQERTYEPLGGIETVKADVRIIAATHRNLEKMVAEGEFREDLYYRINIAKLELPALAERKEDIPLLVEKFISKFNLLMRKDITGIDPSALSLLVAHDWPGNIRELENVIERAFILCSGGRIGIEHLSEQIKITGNNQIEDNSITVRKVQGIVEIQLIEDALKRNNFNRLATAKELGMHKTTLFRKIKKLGIILPDKDGRSK